MKQRAFIFSVLLALLAVSAWTGTRAQAAQPRQAAAAAAAAAAAGPAAPADAGPGVAYQAPGTPSPSVAGATTPFTTYQAPEGTLGGGASVVSLTSAPTSEYDSPQGEASGHAYVQLTGTGQSVQWTNDTGEPITFVNVRASIPDSSAGGGATATLDLYVNGTFRQALNMNSIQSWQYEGNNNYNGSDENPADGDPRAFWDEFHAWISGAAIPAGATFSLQEDAANTAQFYWINSVDVWDAPAPLAQPANSISITSCGAVADNTATNGTAAAGATDSTVDIQNCVNQAQTSNEILWIPQGTFYLIGTNSIVVNNITVEGAGYLYSEIYRDVPLPNNTPLGAAFQCYSCSLENFHIDSDATSRAEVDGGGGAEDTTGTNWRIEDMWVQHVESSLWASGSGGIAESNFFTAIFADGCNLNNVSLTGTSGSNLTATNNFIRGTGDDGMAINSVAYNGSTTYTAMTGITMTHNTVIAPWGGKGIGIYGGSGHLVEDNYLADTARYIGLGVGRFGVNGSDMTGATVSGNVIVRAGGNAYFQGQPALQIGNGGDGQNTGVVSNATVTGNTILDSVYDSVGFSTSTSTDLADNTITSPWRNGVVISPPYYPAPTGNATISGNTVTGVSSGNSAYLNDSSGFTATLTGNSWQSGGTGEGPYGGTAAAVPGTVQAANYDTGGQGVAYNVTSVNGTANSYRSDGVDLETCSDTGCGYDLGWTSAGQWFRYTVNVATAGTYTVSYRVAAPSAVTDAFHVASSSGTNLSGSVNVPATGGWQDWTTVTGTVQLPAGQQTLTVDQDNGGWNIRYLTFASSGGGTQAALTASPPSLSFGDEVTGQHSSAQPVTVTNPGSSSVSITQLAVSGPFAQTSTCGTSLGAGATCTVSVQFEPTATGAASGSLQVTSSAPGSPLTVPLSGTGISASTNLALNQPVTDSGYTQAYVPSNAVDGNTSTYWESTDSDFPQWLQVDLGSPVSIAKVVMDLPPSSSWGTRTQTITIAGSTDGTTYTTLAASAGYTFTSPQNTVTVTFPAATVRYLKLTFTANTAWPAGQLSELQVYP
jgi:F5/8 type C domain/Carbohydrate binding module (family 6)/Abnormal spindle-like microcephaly-assoc'd, ASPM-SPD-2-Hydin